MNQPPITLITPVTLNTALSRLQALSAKDEPIATINVTYVVDNGNLKFVPIVISIDASTRFTAARTTSKAAPSSSSTSCLLNRLSIHLFIHPGMYCIIQLLVSCVTRTMLRAARLVPNISSPSSWRLRSTLVLITLRAFFDVAIAIIITTPAAKR